MLPILLISATYFIFNNEFFYTCNIIALILLFSIMIIMLVIDKVTMGTTIKKVVYLLLGPVEFLEEAFGSIIETIAKLFKKKEINKKKNETMRKIILGIVITIPILIVVLILLASADTIFFSEIVNLLFNVFSLGIFESEAYVNLFLRIIIILFLSVYLIALLYNILEDNFCDNDVKSKEKKGIDKIIGNTVLTILNIVYLVFCYIQISALFMKMGNMLDYEYATYARQGFFQLMAVSLINLSLILITFRRNDQDKRLNYTKIMNICLAIFTLIILCSSFYRMYLYEQEFGYTFLRLMVYFVLITEAILIIATIMYIIGMKIKLSKTFFVVIVSMYIIVNYINIDNMIAKNNIDRYFASETKKEIDLNYLQTLSVDATSQIKRLENVEDKELKYKVESCLYYLKNSATNTNFKNFNINRVIAKNII